MHSPGPKIRVGLHGRHLGVDLLRESKTKGGEEIVAPGNLSLPGYLGTLVQQMKKRPLEGTIARSLSSSLELRVGLWE